MQLAIDFDTPALPVAQAMGEIGMKRALDHAEADEPGFSERAQAFDRFIAMANKPSLRVVSVRRSGE